MKRYKNKNRKIDRKKFRKTANRTKKINNTVTTFRGGVRL